MAGCDRDDTLMVTLIQNFAVDIAVGVVSAVQFCNMPRGVSVDYRLAVI